MTLCRLLILTALLPEARALARIHHIPAPSPSKPSQKGDLGIAIIGLRAKLLPNLPKSIQPQALMLAGLAGALAPDLKIGDIVIEAPQSIRQFLQPPIHEGVIHSSADLISTPKQKETLFKKTGALAVDMESDPVRHLAQGLRIPLIIIRAISDTAAQQLDPKFLGLIDDHGRPRTGRALATIARNPKSLPEMLQLKRATDLALKSLAAAVRAVVESGWPAPPSHAKIS